MDETLAYQNVLQSALSPTPLNYPIPDPNWERREAEEKQRQMIYAAQSLRERALGAAISALHGTDKQTDWNVTIKMATAFLAFIEAT
jgi:hypothetical protein